MEKFLGLFKENEDKYIPFDQIGRIDFLLWDIPLTN